MSKEDEMSKELKGIRKLLEPKPAPLPPTHAKFFKDSDSELEYKPKFCSNKTLD